MSRDKGLESEFMGRFRRESVSQGTRAWRVSSWVDLDGSP